MFMVSITSFKSSSIQHDVNLVNDGPSLSKIDDKAGYALGCGYHSCLRTLINLKLVPAFV